MRRKLISGCLALAFGVTAGYATTVLAQAKPDVLVKQRQAAMVLVSKYWGPLNGMAQGKIPYNAEAATRNAEFLDTLAKMPWDGFDPSTKNEKTRALPAVYENPAKFKEGADRLQKATAKLVTAAKSGDEGSFKAAAGEVGKSCGACHNDFRSK